MRVIDLCGLTLGVSTILFLSLTVNSDFTLTLNFINYTNPSGLCAECNTTLDNVTLDQIVPVCCDQISQTDNCNNTGEESCDTRFRWILREFNASIETRPATVLMAHNPPYFFNPCSRSTSMCPFSETSHTFDQGVIGFLGTPNPYFVYSTGPWMGRIQFYIEPNDGVPKIIDSIPVNLDTLQLGADFTEEMTYTGYHNISHMRMSFKVGCFPSYCGPDCTVYSVDNPRVMSCASNGQITCVNGYDPGTNCSTCLFGWDSERDCTECLPGWNMSTSCTTCLSGYTGEDCMAVIQVTSSTTGSNVPISDAVNAALVGGITGAVLVIIIAILIVVIIVLAFAYRKSLSNFNVSGTGNSNTTSTAIDMKENVVYGVSQTSSPPQTTTDEIELQANVLYGANTTRRETELDSEDQTIYINEDLGPRPAEGQVAEYEYVSIRT